VVEDSALKGGSMRVAIMRVEALARGEYDVIDGQK